MERCDAQISVTVDEGLQEEKSYSEIGRIISEEIGRLFEARVSPDAIRKRVSRRQPWTNVQTKSKQVEIPPDMKPPKSKMGGVRLGAGRPPKPYIPTFNATTESIEWAKWTWNPVTRKRG